MKNSTTFKRLQKVVMASTLLSIAASGVTNLNAADWLMLQGSQPEFVAPKGVSVPYRSKKPKLWGFIQTNYKSDGGTVAVSNQRLNPAGVPVGPPGGRTLTPFVKLNPDLKDTSGFNVFRARIALRGMADNNNLINYFFMTEFANNAINNLVGHRNVATYFSDASITLKHIPYAKLRVGMFKTPGSEEGLQAVFVSPYIEFTSMSNQQLLERKVLNVKKARPWEQGGRSATLNYISTSIDEPIGAFRDTGAQIFDTIDVADDLSLTYAYMYGNGNGISMKSSDARATHYGYLALENHFTHNRGYYHQSFKMFTWIQDGKRPLDVARTDATTGAVTTTTEDFKRLRYGVGMTYYRKGLRFEAEYMAAQGMIFNGAKDVNTDSVGEDWQFAYAVGNENKADGGYVNLQYEIMPKKFEFFVRYDVMDRLSNDKVLRRKFKTTTLGCSYRFRGATRLDFNYLIKDIKAPGNAAARKVLENVGNRFAVQFTAAF
ncbi:hypothetical protein JHD50_04395 [Sulfurimonas sp. MAG313]|nr:hypothetical protein [Sulfurimonas sp. MAG313]MDF1880548.1 hypothetical protein [Sulfurimonas sp. MAG313]